MQRIGFLVSYHRPPLGRPGARLLAPQDDHDVVVLELTRPADVAEMGDVGTGTARTDWLPPARVLPSYGASIQRKPWLRSAAEEFTLMSRRPKRSPVFGEDDPCPALQLCGSPGSLAC